MNLPTLPFLKAAFGVAAVLLICVGASAQEKRLKRIEFMDVSYNLAWHSEPTPGYTKHEYLPKKQSLPHYNNMLMLELLSTEMSVDEVVRAQVDFLKKQGKSNPVAIYGVLTNPSTGEVLLDFMISGFDSKVGAIIEWNAYRYVPHVGEGGQTGSLLYAYSERVYGQKKMQAFQREIAEKRGAIINALATAEVPQLYESKPARR